LGQKASRIRLLILDVDGVLTDGAIVLGSGGMDLKHFHTLDGLGIATAREAGLEVAIITARVSEAVETRANELGIKDFFQGRLNKKETYQHLLEKYDLRDEQVAYIGDDLVDLPVMLRVGLKVAVANADSQLKEVADYVTIREGGHGAVREVVDLLMGWREQKESSSGEQRKRSRRE
jgi:3-deoxy-D-manno-octulosonate 8-phosphate phosphatase (KDO 8-P phosphatase)